MDVIHPYPVAKIPQSPVTKVGLEIGTGKRLAYCYKAQLMSENLIIMVYILIHCNCTNRTRKHLAEKSTLHAISKSKALIN